MYKTRDAIALEKSEIQEVVKKVKNDRFIKFGSFQKEPTDTSKFEIISGLLFPYIFILE